jgi:CIC family chloride channel protein
MALQRLPDGSRFVALIMVYGLAASLVAVAFEVGINWMHNLVFVFPSQPSSPQFHWFPWISLAVISVVSIISGWLLSTFCPEAAGSGIPQLKLAFWKDFGHTPARIAWVKFIAAGLGIGGGLSLGREGPSVQIGGNIASTIGGLFGVAKQNKRAAAAAGAAAGLAAAFNAPLAAVAFVLEEILEDLNSRLLGPVLLASLIGAFVVHGFIGAQPAFDVPNINEPTWRAYALMPFSAIFATLAGVVFQRGSLALRLKSRSWKKLPPMWRPLLGGWITWIFGMAIYEKTGHLGVFALGYGDLTLALVKGIAWKLALALLVAKLIATIACYGLGGSGGIFSPSLFFGGMCGIAVAGISSQFSALNDSDRILLVVGGMSACLGGVVQAPVTAVLIIFEMTHQFALVPGLMVAGLVSQLLARWCNHENFYQAVLTQDGHQMEHVIPPRDLRSWQNLPISAIAHFQPVVIENLNSEAITLALGKTPYDRFPVVKDGALSGIMLRSEVVLAETEGRAPRPIPAVSAKPSQTVRQCQALLIESTCGLIVIVDETRGLPLAVVTLHDLLRAQVAMTDREG